jgi:hypothetical protein
MTKPRLAYHQLPGWPRMRKVSSDQWSSPLTTVQTKLPNTSPTARASVSLLGGRRIQRSASRAGVRPPWRDPQGPALFRIRLDPSY